MRPRGSITGPLVIIALGVLFLIHAFSPEFPIADLIGQYWPYLLIAWGVISLVEVSFRFFGGRSIPVNGVSGGGWLAVILICLVGLTMFQVRSPDTWWRHTDWGRGFNDAFGEQHDYPVPTVEKRAGSQPHIVIENLRGDLKIAGDDTASVTVSGHKLIRAFKADAAERSNTLTPVEVSVDGNDVVIRCNQDRAVYRTTVNTNLELTVPKGASVDVSGTAGDMDVSSLTGDVKVRSGNAGVRLQDLGGNVSVDTRRSDLVRCTNVKGTVDLRGHGSDVELSKVLGQVTINGDFNGTISLHDLSKPVSVQNTRTDVQAERVAGELRLDRGSLSMQNVTGPVKVTGHSIDVTLEGFTNGLEVSVDRGDIDLKPGQLPIGKMAVHTSAGNIELALPPAANFALTASTTHGQVENEFGDVLKEQTSGPGARLDGTVGTGPEVMLEANRGNITIRKSSDVGQATSLASVADN